MCSAVVGEVKQKSMWNITFRKEAQCEGWIETIRTKTYAVASEPLLPADFASPDLSSQLSPAFPLWTTNSHSFSSFKYTRARMKIIPLSFTKGVFG